MLLLVSFAACAMGQMSVLTTPVGSFPALSVQPTVGTQQRPLKGSDFRKTMTISPKLTIEGGSRLVPIPAAEAIMIIVTMDTQAKYKNNTEVYHVLTAETIPIPAAQMGERRSFTFAESTVTYDAYRDNSNVGGETYKYYVFALRDPASKEIIDFKSNNPPLMTEVKAHPEKRAELLGLAKGAKFPIFK